MQLRYSVLMLLCLLVSCASSPNETYQPVTDEVREDAYRISFAYLGMRYAWGGQNFWHEADGCVDCSGLVINIYTEACAAHGCSLPFEDATAKLLHDEYTIPIAEPSPGDLIFMGDEGVVSHVAVFHRFADDGTIEFLDAFSKENLVVIRSYPRSDSKIISFGRIIAR